jgi:hypothetical protein
MPLHLLTIWNPSYADSAIDAHIAVLLRARRACAASNVSP